MSNTNDLDGKAICCGGLPATDENPSNPLEEKAYNTATDKKLETLWLHRHCELPFLDAQDEGLDIPECLKVENRGKWGKPSGDLS